MIAEQLDTVDDGLPTPALSPQTGPRPIPRRRADADAFGICSWQWYGWVNQPPERPGDGVPWSARYLLIVRGTG